MLHSEAFAGDGLEGHQRGDRRRAHGYVLAAAQEDVGKGAEERTVEAILRERKKQFIRIYIITLSYILHQYVGTLLLLSQYRVCNCPYLCTDNIIVTKII